MKKSVYKFRQRLVKCLPETRTFCSKQMKNSRSSNSSGLIFSKSVLLSNAIDFFIPFEFGRCFFKHKRPCFYMLQKNSFSSIPLEPQKTTKL